MTVRHVEIKLQLFHVVCCGPLNKQIVQTHASCDVCAHSRKLQKIDAVRGRHYRLRVKRGCERVEWS